MPSSGAPDGLGGSDKGGVQHLFVVAFAGDFVGFLDNAVDCGTRRALGFLAEQLEGLFKSSNLLLGLAEMRLEGGAEVAVGGLFDHVRQSLLDLVFRVIDVLQHMQVEIVHRLDVFGEESHRLTPLLATWMMH